MLDGRGRKAEAALERQVEKMERMFEAKEGVGVVTATTVSVVVMWVTGWVMAGSVMGAVVEAVVAGVMMGTVTTTAVEEEAGAVATTAVGEEEAAVTVRDAVQLGAAMKLLREVRRERTGRGGGVFISPSGDGGGEGGAEPGGGEQYISSKRGRRGVRAGRRKQMNAMKMSTTVRRAAKTTTATSDG